jgi:glycosyltransferase involved in cell wall biosynthesis
VNKSKTYRHTFTIFIPTYNRAHTLPRALDSVANQSFDDFEVLIIDDGSVDGTDQLIKQLKEKYTFPIHYYWQTNQGKHVAHNTALKFANGEFIVTLDSDDLLEPKALERFFFHWNQIPGTSREKYAGIEGLCELLETAKRG